MNKLYLLPAVIGALVLYHCGGLTTRDPRVDQIGTGGQIGAAGQVGIAGAEPVMPCSPRSVNDGAGVFVDTHTGEDAFKCGGRSAPCKTIGGGIASAGTTGKNLVYVAAGTYNESIRLSAGLRVEGAWRASGTSWQPLCDAGADTAVTIRAPDGADITVTADGFQGAATLASVAVLSRDTPATILGHPGASLYGVFARGAGTHLTLDHVAVSVSKAGNGADGALGVDGADGDKAGCAGGGLDGADGAGAGTNGASAGPGTFDRDGYVPANGSPGTDGRTGHNGSAPAVASTCLTGCGSCDNPSSQSCTMTPNSCGTAGKLGCAGAAGTGAGAGFGGGSSIALYIWDATVDVIGGSLRADGGGNGGTSGPGGHGGLGSYGVPGQVASNACSRCSADFQGTGYGGNIFVCTTMAQGSGQPGGPGGKGGNGTDGGHGGDGRGGSSCAVYENGNATVSVSASSELTFGVSGGGPDIPGTAALICN